MQTENSIDQSGNAQNADLPSKPVQAIHVHDWKQMEELGGMKKT